MIDIIKTSIFPTNVIAGVATGFSEQTCSYFPTPKYSTESINNSRKALETSFKDLNINFVYQKQVHSDIVQTVNSTNMSNLSDSDSLITSEQDLMLNISIADCQAILIYDNVNNIIAGVHSGWKGTQTNIVGKTIETLQRHYNSQAENLLVYLAPSACVDNYEVGNEFIGIFPNSILESKGKYYFDNRKQILFQLESIGIILQNIESNNDCTITNNRYHSHRRDGLDSGRMSAFIGIRRD